MNVDELLEYIDWDKYFDVEVSEELFELEDVDLDENSDEIGELCGTESLCCVSQAHITEPLAREETSHDDDQVNTCTVATTTTPTPRFPKRVTNDNFIKKAVLERVPKNTRSTNWGVRVFEAWCVERQCIGSVVDMSDKDLDSNISQFVHEAVKRDGTPNSLYQLVVSIQRHLGELGRPKVSFLDSPMFDTLRKSLDARMKELTAQGLGVERKLAEPITQDMEAILWEKGIFSVESCKGLINVMYFYNCKCFGLRSGDEHRSLDVEQFRFCVSDGIDYVEYIGRTSKTYKGGLNQRKLLPKNLRVYAVPEIS